MKESETVRVGIDARSLKTGLSGMHTYVANLLAHIPCLDRIDDLRPKNNFLWNNLRVPYTAFRRDWALFHAPSYTCPLLKSCSVVLTVHDVSYLVKEEWYPYHLDPFRKAYYRASMGRADRIIVPSQFSADEITRIQPALESRLRKIPMAVSESFYPDSDWAAQVRDRYELPEEYLLHVGDIHMRRNIPMIQEAAGRLGLELVLVGKVLAQESFDPSSCRLMPPLTISELRGVYSGATAFVYPSVYEGFGLPLLEAMACGLPVVASRRASIPEVCGEAAVLVEPDRDSLEQGIHDVLEERQFYSRKGKERAEQFTWQRVAASTEAVYRELL